MICHISDFGKEIKDEIFIPLDFCPDLRLGNELASFGNLIQAADNNSTYTFGPATRDGIGKFYMGREISKVMGHLGASWLERPKREQEERTDLLIKGLNLKPTDKVADIGAGSGYFSFRMAKLTSSGKSLRR